MTKTGLSLTQPHSNQKRLLAEALADSHERAIFVDTPTVTRNVFARNPLPDNGIDESTPERTTADRLILALRPSLRPDEVPLGSVTKRLAGRAVWLVVYEADVLAGLLRMGWTEGGE